MQELYGRHFLAPFGSFDAIPDQDQPLHVAQFDSKFDAQGNLRNWFTPEDLKKFDVPTLILHGDDDQIVPYADSAPLSAKLLKNVTLKTYEGFPHGMPTTHADKINADLLEFITDCLRLMVGGNMNPHELEHLLDVELGRLLRIGVAVLEDDLGCADRKAVLVGDAAAQDEGADALRQQLPAHAVARVIQRRRHDGDMRPIS